METKKFKINSTASDNGGKKLTKSSILSKAGFTIAGIVGGTIGGSVSGLAVSASRQPEQPVEVNDSEVVDETPIEAESTQQEPTSEVQQQQQEITEPQPIDNNLSNGSPSYSNVTEDVIDPKDVAQSIAQEVDVNDIDSDNIFTPEGYDYAYLPDGTQQPVIIGHTSDGVQYVLADLDGDGMYGDIFDMNGNYVAEANGLSVSDIVDMVDDSGGFLAATNETEEIDNAELDEALLAQLTSGPEEDKEERVIEEERDESEEIEESEEEPENESEDDSMRVDENLEV